MPRNPDPGDVDVDHMVPLKNAHNSGGWDWSPAMKEDYANHLRADDHLIGVRDRVNQSNLIWAPVVKLWATPDSRRFHYPIESIYSAFEVKQTLGFHELDQAMEKLVKLSRLNRPNNPYGHITENQHITIFDKEGFSLNPLQTVVLGARIQQGGFLPGSGDEVRRHQRRTKPR